jgi:phosphomannomutase
VEHYFPAADFGAIVWLDYTDGLRMGFDQGDVIHLRPSGNADEFRVYVVSNTQSRSDWIARKVAMDEGVFSRMRADFQSEMLGV